MSDAVRLDLRPFISVELEGHVYRDATGRPTLTHGPTARESVRWLTGLGKALGKWDRVAVRVTLERQKATRSQEANSYLWAVVYPVLLDGLRQIALDAGEESPVRSCEHLHEICKATFLPAVELPGGLKDRPTTTTLDTAAFAAYVDAIVRYGAERGIYVPTATHEGMA